VKIVFLVMVVAFPGDQHPSTYTRGPYLTKEECTRELRRERRNNAILRLARAGGGMCVELEPTPKTQA
jgi:hypothetical protein